MKGLTKILLAGLTIASLILPNKAKGQTPIWYDAFSPRNEVVNYFGSYGSGDVDQDGDVDADDFSAMNTTQNFYSDVDADGNQSTAQDKQILEDYLNGNIQYMPAEYWKSTPSEKKEWVRKIYPIMTELNDKTYVTSNNIDERFTSDNFSVQDFLTGNGYSPTRDDFGLIHPKYNLEYNGLFTIPIYIARVHSDDGTFNHGISAIFTGTNLNNLEDWMFLEPQSGEIREPGSWSIPYNSEIAIKGVHNFKDSNTIDIPRLYNAVKIHIDGNGNREIIFMNPNMILNQTSLAIGDEENTNISSNYLLKQNYPNPFNSTTTIQFTIPFVETHRKASLQLIVYNINGKKIATLKNNINAGGSYKVEWNAAGYPSGIYFYQLQYNSGIIATRKMLLLR